MLWLLQQQLNRYWRYHYYNSRHCCSNYYSSNLNDFHVLIIINNTVTTTNGWQLYFNKHKSTWFQKHIGYTVMLPLAILVFNHEKSWQLVYKLKGHVNAIQSSLYLQNLLKVLLSQFLNFLCKIVFNIFVQNLDISLAVLASVSCTALYSCRFPLSLYCGRCQALWNLGAQQRHCSILQIYSLPCVAHRSVKKEYKDINNIFKNVIGSRVYTKCFPHSLTNLTLDNVSSVKLRSLHHTNNIGAYIQLVIMQSSLFLKWS